jgi:hypothetical protein
VGSHTDDDGIVTTEYEINDDDPDEGVREMHECL